MGKGGKERIVPFNQAAERALRAWLKDRAAILATRRTKNEERRTERRTERRPERRTADAPSAPAMPLFVNYRGHAADGPQRRSAAAAVRRAVQHADRRQPARAAAFVCDPSAAARRRPAHHPGAAGPRAAQHDAALHARQRGAADRRVPQSAPASAAGLPRLLATHSCRCWPRSASLRSRSRCSPPRSSRADARHRSRRPKPERRASSAGSLHQNERLKISGDVHRRLVARRRAGAARIREARPRRAGDDHLQRPADRSRALSRVVQSGQRGLVEAGVRRSGFLLSQRPDASMSPVRSCRATPRRGHKRVDTYNTYALDYIKQQGPLREGYVDWRATDASARGSAGSSCRSALRRRSSDRGPPRTHAHSAAERRSQLRPDARLRASQRRRRRRCSRWP